MKGLAEPEGIISQSYTLEMQPTAVWPFTPSFRHSPVSAAFVKDKDAFFSQQRPTPPTAPSTTTNNDYKQAASTQERTQG